MKPFAPILAAVAISGLSGCDSFRLFNDYRVVESESVEAAEWPRLVDVPEAPPPGVYTEDVPDPTTGLAVESALSGAAGEAAARRSAAAEPVLSETDRALLRRDEQRLRESRRAVISVDERLELARREIERRQRLQQARRAGAAAQTGAGDGSE